MLSRLQACGHHMRTRQSASSPPHPWGKSGNGRTTHRATTTTMHSEASALAGMLYQLYACTQLSKHWSSHYKGPARSGIQLSGTSLTSLTSYTMCGTGWVHFQPAHSMHAVILPFRRVSVVRPDEVGRRHVACVGLLTQCVQRRRKPRAHEYAVCALHSRGTSDATMERDFPRCDDHANTLPSRSLEISAWKRSRRR